MTVLESISIGINPNLIDGGGLALSWHGFMTFAAVAVAVFLVVRWGSREGLNADAIYAVAFWGILGGVVGARLLHVIDAWSYYENDPVRIVYVWSGGVTVYGAILGGFVFAAAYMIIRNSEFSLEAWRRYFRFLGEPVKAPLPSVGRLADITAPAMLVAQAIGRVGDVINGEHCAKFTSLPWGVVYTHPERQSLACEQSFGPGPTHPAVAYELLMDVAILAALWPLRKRLHPPGMFFALYLATYSVGRFGLSFLRVEYSQYGPLNEAQIIALLVLVVTVPLLMYKAQLLPAEPPDTGQTRRQRRRQGSS